MSVRPREAGNAPLRSRFRRAACRLHEVPSVDGHRTSLSVGVAALLACSLFCAPAGAQERARPEGPVDDTWSEPNPGVRYLRRTIDSPAVSVHALVVDLARPGVRVVATPHDERWGTVTDFAHAQRAAAAVNGGFWGTWQRPTGITAGGGTLWEGAEPDPEFGHFGIERGGRAVVYGPGEGEDPRALARLSESVSGRPMLVRDGEVAGEELDAFATSNQRQPRTAAGVSRDGRTLILAVVDGRQSHSHGLTLYQLARLMIELGAARAINLDGGGSSAMFVERAGGVVSSPSRGRWVRALGLDVTDTRRVRTRAGVEQRYVRGVEREVMNQIAVLAPPPAEVAVEAHSALGDGLGPVGARHAALFVPAGRAPLRLGRVRGDPRARCGGRRAGVRALGAALALAAARSPRVFFSACSRGCLLRRTCDAAERSSSYRPRLVSRSPSVCRRCR